MHKFCNDVIMKLLNIVFLTLAASSAALAQDRHFSQFYASPLSLNPALTGQFDGKYRVGGVYREQYRGLLDKPYQTFSFGSDFRFDAPSRSAAKDKIGAGLYFMKDVVPNLEFSTTQLAISGAYHKSLNFDNSQYLSAGFQFGFTQRNVNYEFLTFQDQWNGENGFTLPRSEVLSDNNFGYGDLSLGINYAVNPGRRRAFFAGLAYFHANRPNVSFFRSVKDAPKIPIYPKLSGHIAGQIPLWNDGAVSLSPRLLAMWQGPHLEATAGANIRFELNTTTSSGVHFGTWVRGVRQDNIAAVESLVFLTGFELNNVLLGLSYDLHLNLARNSMRVPRTFEISLIYLGAFENDDLLCPEF